MKYGIEFATVELAGTQANKLVGVPQGAVFECWEAHPMFAVLHFLTSRLSDFHQCFRIDVEHDPLLISPKWSNGVTTLTLFLDDKPSLQFIVRYVSASNPNFFPKSLPGLDELSEALGIGSFASRVPSKYGLMLPVHSYLIKSGSDAIHPAEVAGLPDSLRPLIDRRSNCQNDALVHLVQEGVHMFSLIKCKDSTPQIEIPVTLDSANPWHEGDGTFLLNLTFSDEIATWGLPLKIQGVSDAN